MKAGVWKRIFVAACAASMFIAAPGMTVLAGEIKEAGEKDSIIEESFSSDPTEEVVGADVIEFNAGWNPAVDWGEETPDGGNVTCTYDPDTGAASFYSVGCPDTIFNPDTGVSYFYPDGWPIEHYWWMSLSDKIKTIQGVTSGTVYLKGADYLCSEMPGLTDVALNGFKLEDPTSIKSMFRRCKSLKNVDWSGFDTSNVTDMSYLFSGCASLENADWRGFDASNVMDMGGLFSGCESLKNVDWSGFDTSSVTNMNSMFSWCQSLADLDLSSFETSNVTNMSRMFEECPSLTSLDLSGFDTSNVTDMSKMFRDCMNLTSLDLSGCDLSNVTNMDNMFEGCDSLTSLDLSGCVLPANMKDLFSGLGSLTSVNFSGCDTSKVTNMSGMFADCGSLTSLNLSGFDTSNVTDMANMFSGCSNLKSLDLSNFVTSNVTDMMGMFSFCSSLTNLNLGSFNTSAVTNMSGMFYECSKLTNLDLRSFDTSNVTDMSYMFCDCDSLTSLDLSSFDMSKVTNAESVFNQRTSLSELQTPKKNTHKGIDLPVKMYDKSGKEYGALPVLSESILLTRPYPRKSIANANISGISKSYGYSGKAYTPDLNVILDGKTLTKSVDYTVRYENNKNPGTAKIIITGTGKYTGTKTKTFEIVECSTSLTSGKTYLLIPKNNSGTAVCSYSGKMVNNTKVYITDRSSSEAMKFKAVKNSDGTWKFINVKCELALAVQQNSREIGKGLVLYDQTTKPAQNWKLSKKSDNSFAIINSVSDLSIAMSDASAVKGTTLSMAVTESSGLQRFYLKETDPVNTIFDGTYAVRASKDISFAMMIAASSSLDGANANLYKYNDTKEMKFKVMYSGGGYYRLVNTGSGLCITVDGNTKTNDANVIQSKWAALSGQRWRFVINSNGTVTLTNALGTNLHLVSNLAKNGSNIVARNASTSGAQKWYLSYA